MHGLVSLVPSAPNVPPARSGPRQPGQRLLRFVAVAAATLAMLMGMSAAAGSANAASPAGAKPNFCIHIPHTFVRYEYWNHRWIKRVYTVWEIHCFIIFEPIPWEPPNEWPWHKPWPEGKEIYNNPVVIQSGPLNVSQKASVELGAKVPSPVQTVPVSQGSLAVVAHLPSGCTATSTAAPGRLVLSDKTLNGVFSGSVKTWGEVTEGGDVLMGAGCSAQPIQPIVDEGASGSTHIFKRFLGQISGSAMTTEGGSFTWNELGEESENGLWPTAAGVAKPAEAGDTGVVADVASTPSSIGYAPLGAARENSAFGAEGGSGKATFWAEIESSSTKGKAKYADPSTNGESGTAAESNCKKTVYTNGLSTFPPASTTAPWNEVSSAVTSKTYPLCGFTYALAVTKYSAYPGTTEEVAKGAKEFLKFLVSNKKEAGQKLMKETDAQALPKAVLLEASKGVEEVGF